MNCGIYQLENLINGHIYIGQSSDIVGRKREHRYKLKNGLHENPYLQNAVRKYGIGNFFFSILLYCDPFNLSLYEQMCIDNLKPEYNILTECVGTSLGYKHTEDARKKMSERWHETHQSRIGHKLSEETRQRMSEAQKKRAHNPMSEETRRKMSESRKGKQAYIITEETKRKMSKSQKLRWKTPMPEETRKKLSEAQKKRFRTPVSDESRRKMSEAKKGKRPYTMTEEIKKKISESKKGKKPYEMTDEIRQKLSEKSKAHQQKLREQRPVS